MREHAQVSPAVLLQVERQIDQMVKFIKQEAEEKANEISVSAEEVSSIKASIALRAHIVPRAAGVCTRQAMNALERCLLHIDPISWRPAHQGRVIESQSRMLMQVQLRCRSSILRSCNFWKQRRQKSARTMKEGKGR